MPSKCSCEPFLYWKFHFLPLKKENIQKLRKWRNHASELDLMLIRKTISTEDQESWYDSLDNHQCYYELRYESIFIAVLQVKNIDTTWSSGEAGVIVNPESKILPTTLTMGILIFYQHFFTNCNFESMTARVKKSNSEMIRLNLDLGFKILQDYGDHISLHLEASRFLNKNRRLLSYFETL